MFILGLVGLVATAGFAYKAGNKARSADIDNNTAINIKQAEEITSLTTENAAQAVDITSLTEAVGEQEKIMATCIIVSAVAAIAITSFVAFCIYQGVKLEREKEKNSSKDTPDAKLSNVDTTDGAEKLQNNLKVANI